MKKIFILFFTCIFAFAKTPNFKTIFEKYDEYGERGEVVKFFKNNKLILSFVLNESGGDCLNKEYQQGVYFFKNNKLYLYTKWFSKNNLGYQKTVYFLTDNTPKKLLSIFWIKNPKEDIQTLQKIYNSHFIIDKKQQKKLEDEFKEAQKKFVKNLWKR